MAASNVIDYIDIHTNAGNALDRGDLSVARLEGGTASGSLYGTWQGGTYSNVIDYIDINVTAAVNAVDRGNLTTSPAACAGSG